MKYKKHKNKKSLKALSVILCFIMIFNCCISAFAEEALADNNESNEVIESNVEEVENKDDNSELISLEEDGDEDSNVLKSLSYIDDDVTITVSEMVEGTIPEGSSLRIIPITEGSDDLSEEYKSIEDSLKEKSLSQGYSMSGFLAYDISFLNEDGLEVEPDGNVFVSMEYNEAVEVSNPSNEVTVMHFSENHEGVVEDIVDLRESANIEVSEENGVTKAEFSTDSFSVFTIVWMAGISVDIHCIDMNGNSIGEEKFVNDYIVLEDENGISISDIPKDIVDYSFKRSFIVRNSNYDFQQDLKRVRFKNNQWQYSVEDNGGNWINFNPSTYSLYFEYESSVGEGKATRVPVVDTKAKGINISLFDYTDRTKNSNIESEQNGFNFFSWNGADWTTGKVGPTSSVKGDDGTDWIHFGEYSYSIPYDFARQNLVCYNLSNDGFPVLNGNYNGAVKIQSENTVLSENTLGYLFDEGSSSTDFKAYTGLTGLLQQDSRGYYYYDSSLNHAQLNKESSHIDVYSERLAHRENTIGYFLPFNDIYKASDNDGDGVYSFPSEPIDSMDDVDGDGVSDQHEGNLWFGLKIDTEFYQPRGGYIGGDPMVFDFSGDDDVWVFLDGVKVLDIGGVHGEIEGHINFATGEVVVVDGIKDGEPGSESENKPDFKTTILDCYKKAYEENPEGKGTLEEYLSEYFVVSGNDYTPYYRDNSSHRFDFFYLERGAGVNNCKIGFNVPTLEESSILVHKEISNYDDGGYNDVEFSFRLYTKYINEEKPELSETEYHLVEKGTRFTLIKDDGTEVAKEVGEGGIFKLKHNEKARFLGYSKGSGFYAEEVDISSQTYDIVKIISSEVTNNNGDIITSDKDANIGDPDITEGETSITSKELVVGKDSLISFHNNCAETNIKQLIINKKVVGFEDDSEFSVKVLIADRPYVGGYKVGNSYDEAVNSEELKTSDGILKMKDGQVAIVLGNVEIENGKRGFPSETTFKVLEVLDSNSYNEPIFSVKSETASSVSVSNGFSGYAYGKILLNSDAWVTVTNAKKGSIAFIKTDYLTGNTIEGVNFTLYKLIDEDTSHNHGKAGDSNCWEEVAVIPSDENGMVLVQGLDSNSVYGLVETPLEDYALPESLYWKLSVGNDDVVTLTTVCDDEEYTSFVEEFYWTGYNLDAHKNTEDGSYILDNIRLLRELEITKSIKVSDINFNEGNPTFLFKLVAECLDGKTRTYYKSVEFDKSYVDLNTDEDGYVSLKANFNSLIAGNYVLNEEEVSRHQLESISSVENGVVNGEVVEFDLVTNISGSATYINSKYENQWFSHNDIVINSIN